MVVSNSTFVGPESGYPVRQIQIGVFFERLGQTLKPETRSIVRKNIDGCLEAVVARLDDFCGIYGAWSVDRWRTKLPAFRFALLHGRQSSEIKLD